MSPVKCVVGCSLCLQVNWIEGCCPCPQSIVVLFFSSSSDSCGFSAYSGTSSASEYWCIQLRCVFHCVSRAALRCLSTPFSHCVSRAGVFS